MGGTTDGGNEGTRRYALRKIVSFRTAAELFDRARTREGGHKCRPILAVVSKAVATADATVAARE